MTDLATRARAAAQAAQVKLHAYREHKESGAALITVEIPLGDVPEAVKAARPGDPFMLALVAMDHNAVEPKAIPVRSRGEALRVKACVLCGDREFQTWCSVNCSQRPVGMTPTEHARGVILSRVGITSRADLVTNAAACDRFEDLLELFESSRGRRYFRSAS
ncbi:MAG: hypothetical protein ACOVVK_11665 [Elsteraceae bacterium]